ncbi:MAG: glycosyltransferase family 9 protein [Sneathiellales bacterium]|nr:glycosyltransferase family 9 protein [Sneathiellales bacterium]
MRDKAFEKILVIKHGALGDVVLAQSPFQAIRHHHPAAHITLLTTSLFKSFLAKSGLFDDIWIDEKPKLWQIGSVLRLRRQMRAAGFDRVYDLQTSSRSSSYFKFFGSSNRPEWSGIAKGCSHPDLNPDRKKMHTIERQREQLRQSGVENFPDPDFTWAKSDIGRFELPERFALLVPGGSAHRPEKRWPARYYGALSKKLLSQGIAPVLIGGKAETDVLDVICSLCPEAIDLANQTSLEDLAALGRLASVAIGNDTGPLHLIAAVGCQSTAIFSHASDPNRARPRGRDVTVLREENLENLSEETVWKSLRIEQDAT